MAGSTAPSANTTYTVSFTTENAVPAGPFSAFQWAMNYSLGGNNFDFNNVDAADVTLTVNGVSRAISSVASSDTVLHIYPSGSLPAGANLVFTVTDVINPNAAGSYGFFDFRTRTTGTDPIDTGSPSSIVIVNPDLTAPTITNVSSDKANGSYTVGEVIDIDVTFSEAVTSTGNVTVTLETGDTDRTCTFTVTSATTGTCSYTVQA